jgi:hypothetical protein
MRTIDWLKAVGIALLLTVLDLGIATLVISIYAWMIDPGHPTDYYRTLAPSIATPSTAIAGPLLMFGANWWFSRSRPDRNPWMYAVAIFAAYVLIDWATVDFRGMLNPVALGITALKLLGALLGAWAAQRWPRDSVSARA